MTLYSTDKFAETLEHKDVASAIVAFFESQCDLDIASGCPVTVYRWERAPAPDLADYAQHLAEIVIEMLNEEEEIADPNGDVEINNFTVDELRVALEPVLASFNSRITPWCHDIAEEITVDADQAEAVLREHVPHWFTP